MELQPSNLFVDKNNIIYIIDPDTQRLYEWQSDSNSPSRIIIDNLYQPYGLFVLSADEIYVTDRDSGQVDKLNVSSKNSEIIAQFCQFCLRIFVDMNDVIYCSLVEVHQIVAKCLDSNLNLIIVVAGTGISGSEAHMLNHPCGIFVNSHFDFYVTDTDNNRIQLFHPNISAGISISSIRGIIV